MTEAFVITMLNMVRAMSPFAMDRIEDRIRAVGREGIDSLLPTLGMELGRMMEQAGGEYGAGHAAAHVLASDVFAQAEDEARYEAGIAQAEAEARWHEQCDLELAWADQDYARYGYVDA